MGGCEGEARKDIVGEQRAESGELREGKFSAVVGIKAGRRFDCFALSMLDCTKLVAKSSFLGCARNDHN